MRPEKGAAYDRTERDAHRAPEPRQYYHDAEKRADYCCGVIFQSQQHRNIPRQAAQDDTCRQFVFICARRSRAGKIKSCDNSRPDDTFHVRAVFIVKTPFSPSQEPEKTLKMPSLRNRGAERSLHEKQGLPSRKRPPIFGLTRKTPLSISAPTQHRLERSAFAYSRRYPAICQQTRRRPGNGLHVSLILRKRFSFRLTAPYSEERREAAQRYARENNVSNRLK